MAFRVIQGGRKAHRASRRADPWGVDAAHGKICVEVDKRPDAGDGLGEVEISFVMGSRCVATAIIDDELSYRDRCEIADRIAGKEFQREKL